MPLRGIGKTLLQGLGLGLAIMEVVARPTNRESELQDQDQEFDEAESASIIPDTVNETIDLNRPGLGQLQTHANSLMEQAAALGALRDGLLASGFDVDEAWVLVRMYARLWWSALHDREVLDYEDDD